ncbi:MAG: tRNA lysidine(34) synthetase TilS [Bacteroidetes bacterium]|nr:MAG: tRNA lysidine(34) synthetase TilS [Bacteroidota bacterium]
MTDKFTQFIFKNKLFLPHEKILLAVSSGMDSVVMTDLFKTAGYHFAIAHCNFKLRGSDSDKDEVFVGELASRLGTEFFTRSFNTKSFAKEKGISIQMAARELRYAWLENIREKHGFSWIATAHHRDDNTETIIYNLTRGTGLKGLQGIPVKNGKIIRPLLNFNREEIEWYIKINSLAYREDLSNREDKYTRNKIRNKIIPLLKEINPAVHKSVQELSEISSKTYRLLDYFISRDFKSHVYEKDGKTFIPVKLLFEYPEREIIIYELLKDFGFKSPEIDEIALSLEKQAGKLFFSQDYVCLKDRDYLIISQRATDEKTEIFIHSDQKEIPFSRGLMRMQTLDIDEINDFKADSNIAYLDFSLLKFPLKLRNPKEGDYFVPFGMSGKKKISDFLTDMKIPRTEKSKVWLLTSDDKIVWVVGLRIDNRFRVKKTTQKLLEIKLLDQTE